MTQISATTLDTVHRALSALPETSGLIATRCPELAPYLVRHALRVLLAEDRATIEGPMGSRLYRRAA